VLCCAGLDRAVLIVQMGQKTSKSKKGKKAITLAELFDHIRGGRVQEFVNSFETECTKQCGIWIMISLDDWHNFLSAGGLEALETMVSTEGETVEAQASAALGVLCTSRASLEVESVFILCRVHSFGHCKVAIGSQCIGSSFPKRTPRCEIQRDHNARRSAQRPR